MMLDKDLREFVALLNKHHVKYVIVGGYAVAFHGHPRYTGDIDVFLERSPENADRIMAALKAFGFGALNLTAADFQESGVIIQLGFPPNRIDLMTSISGVEFDDAWGTRQDITLDDLSISLISKDLLLINKRASNRPKDRMDVQELD